jgi:hypothetical protein
VKTLTLYVGRDCHLCEIARRELAPLGDELETEAHAVSARRARDRGGRY